MGSRKLQILWCQGALLAGILTLAPSKADAAQAPTSSHPEDVCAADGAVCLISDGSSCAITCDGRCWAKSGGCILGFGYDAECVCHNGNVSCDLSCEQRIAAVTGRYGQEVGKILTTCETEARNHGQRGGQCPFDPQVQQSIEGLKIRALSFMALACTDQEIFACYGHNSVDEFGRLLLQVTESAQKGLDQSIFDHEMQ